MQPMLLDPDYGLPLSRGMVGLRIPITRFTCKLKFSQDKDPVTQQQVIAALRAAGPYHHPALADDIERSLDRVRGNQRAGRDRGVT